MDYAKTEQLETIKEHTDSLLENLKILRKIYEKEIIKVINIDKKRFWELLEIICKYHDIGKVYTPFQNIIRDKLGKPLIQTKFSYEILKHEQLSPIFIPVEKYKLTKKDRMSVAWRHQFLQGSWNYERMQNGGWCYSIIPAIKRLYPNKEDQIEALKRHMEFYNTHPYVSAPVMGVTLALEEERANGAEINDQAIQGVKVGMMGPLAGVGDPVFWFTLRPILGALGASLALSGNIVGPLLFFFAWNIIRMAFIWYTQEFGYKVGTSIAKDLSGGLLGKITQGASLLGMFIIGSLVQRWVSISFTPTVSEVTQSAGAFIDWSSLPSGAEGIKSALTTYSQLGASALDEVKVTTLQQNLDQLIPGLAALLLTLLCCWLLKKKVSPIIIIIALFVVGIVAHLIGIM